MVAAFAVLAALVARQSHVAAIAQAEKSASNLALALAQHAGRTFESVDLSLRLVQSRVEADLRGVAPANSVHLTLKDLADASPQIRSLVVLNDEGIIVHDSSGSTPRTGPPSTDRDYFIIHQEKSDAGLFISPTIRNRVNGQWTIIASRRIARPDGSFGGVAIAAVAPEYFRQFYESMGVGESGAIALYSGDGIRLTRSPWIDKAIGIPGPANLIERLKTQSSGVFVANSPNDGAPRIVAHRRSDIAALSIVVGISRDEILRLWRRDMAVLAAATALALAVVAMLGVALTRSLRRVDRSEALFRAVFDHATDGLFINRVDANGRFVVETYNAKAAEIVHLPAAVASGKLISELLPKAEAQKVEADLSRSLVVGAPERFEDVQVRERGNRTWETVQVPLRNLKGDIDRIFVSTRDITHLKLAEAEAHEANRLLVLAEQIAQVGHWRVDLVSNALTWSDEVYRIHGLDRAKFVPNTASAIEFYHPDDRAEVRRCVDEAIACGSGYEFSLRIMRPDGECREVVSRGFCERAADGTVTAIFGTVMDVTDLRQTERDLAEKSAVLEITLDNMDQGLALIAPNGDIKVLNRRCVELMGFLDASMATRPTLQTTIDHFTLNGDFPDFDPRLHAQVFDYATLSEAGVHERRRPNGCVIEIRTRPLTDGSGVVLTCSDITARREAEAALRDSEARYRLLAETTNDVITRLNLEFKREYVSPTCRNLLGYEPEELMGAQPSDSIHPDDAPVVRELARRLVAGKVSGDRTTSTYRTKHKDGRWLWIEAGMTLARDPASGAPISLICSLRDMTQRKRAEQALADSEARYRLLAENTSELIMLGHDDGRKVYISPASERLLGFKPDELSAMRLRDYVHPDDLDRLYATTARLTHGEDQVSVIYRVLHRKRGWIAIEGGFRRIANAAPGQPNIVGTFRDVSERQRQERALEKAKLAAEMAQQQAELASQAKTDFLASMSHEIRTPLHGVIGYADLLIEGGGLTEQQASQAKLIQTSGAALLTVVDDILDFSKIEAGQVELDPRPFSINALVDNTVSIMRGLAETKGLALRVAIADDVPRDLVGDEDRLRQIVLNLLNNAVKFTPRGSIALSVDSLGKNDDTAHIRFSIEDTGLGIAQSRQTRLFQRFSQVDGSIRREFGGTGLGLAISKKLVEVMGGEIGFKSRLSEGSTFWFAIQLPFAIEQLTSVPDKTSVSDYRAKSRVLLVEDMEINQKLALAVLQSAGHEVDVLGDGSDAIIAVQSKHYDIVLMDVQMPGMDGITATQLIRELDHPGRSVPIVAMTANVLPAQIAAFKAAGMDDHVGKPFKRADLLSIVDKVVNATKTVVPTAADATIDTAFDCDLSP